MEYSLIGGLFLLNIFLYFIRESYRKKLTKAYEVQKPEKDLFNKRENEFRSIRADLKTKWLNHFNYKKTRIKINTPEDEIEFAEANWSAFFENYINNLKEKYKNNGEGY